jgi:hypothetical protein
MTPPPLPSTSGEPVVPAPRWSRLAITAFCLAVPVLPAALILPVVLYHVIVDNPGSDPGPQILVLMGATLVGFIAALLGSIALRRMRGSSPDSRGRSLALVAVNGPRALLLASGLAFGAVSLAGAVARQADDGFDAEQTVRRLWIVGLFLVAWYVSAAIRRVRRNPRGSGWGMFAAGILAHVALIVALPASMVGAFVTLHQPQFQVGHDHRMHEMAASFGTYAARDLWIDLPARSKSRLTLRQWTGGKGSDLGTMSLSGTNRLRWVLSESGKTGPHTLTWSSATDGQAAQTHLFEVPSEVTLVPAGMEISLAPGRDGRTNLWLFLPMETAGAPAPSAPPGAGFELVLEPATDPR